MYLLAVIFILLALMVEGKGTVVEVIIPIGIFLSLVGLILFSAYLIVQQVLPYLK